MGPHPFSYQWGSWDTGSYTCWLPSRHAHPWGKGSVGFSEPGHRHGQQHHGPMPGHLINATCHSFYPTAARSSPPPASPHEAGGHKGGRGSIFIVSDTGCPRLSYFMQQAKEASLCYAAAGQAAQPSKGKDRRNAAGRGGMQARGQACGVVHTGRPQGTAPFSPSRCGAAACILLDGAERSPAACKCVCFSSPAPNSIRTNCIWERGGGLGWVSWGLVGCFGFFCFLLKKAVMATGVLLPCMPFQLPDGPRPKIWAQEAKFSR